MRGAHGRGDMRRISDTIRILTFPPCFASASGAYAASDDNLHVYTSPLDITGAKVQFRAAAPDRNTGKQIEVPLPVGPRRFTDTPMPSRPEEPP